MNRPARRRPIALTAAVAAAMLAAGCGTAAPPAPQQAARAGSPALSLNTAVVTTAGTWAVAVMGGSAARHNNFWQLLIRPAGSTRWKLVTPPGTADNGGLVLAGAGPALIAAFRPSQYLRFTPLTHTTDGGQAWSSLSPVGAALASAPDALAAEPASGRLLALLANGTADAIRTRRHHLEDPHQPAGPRRHARRAALRAAGPDRRLLHAVRDSPGRRQPAPGRVRRASSRTRTGPGRPPDLSCPARSPARTSRSSGSPRRRSRRWRCWRQAPARPPACSPPGPPATAAAGHSHPRSRSAERP